MVIQIPRDVFVSAHKREIERATTSALHHQRMLQMLDDIDRDVRKGAHEAEGEVLGARETERARLMTALVQAHREEVGQATSIAQHHQRMIASLGEAASPDIAQAQAQAQAQGTGMPPPPMPKAPAVDDLEDDLEDEDEDSGDDIEDIEDAAEDGSSAWIRMPKHFRARHIHSARERERMSRAMAPHERAAIHAQEQEEIEHEAEKMRYHQRMLQSDDEDEDDSEPASPAKSQVLDTQRRYEKLRQSYNHMRARPKQASRVTEQERRQQAR